MVVSIGDITQVRVGVAYGQILALSNFTYESLSDDPTWQTRLTDVWQAEVRETFCGMLAVDATWDVLEWHEVTPDPDNGEIISLTLGFAGTLGGTPAPGQVAAKVTWYVPGSHRSQRGRSFIGGIGGDQIENSRRISGDLETAMRAWADKMLELWGEDGTESTARFSVLSRTLDGVPRPTPVALHVMEYNVPSIIGTQRRRLL